MSAVSVLGLVSAVGNRFSALQLQEKIKQNSANRWRVCVASRVFFFSFNLYEKEFQFYVISSTAKDGNLDHLTYKNYLC